MNKNGLYYIFLVVSLIIAIFQVITLSKTTSILDFLAHTWSCILFIVILWSKKEFTGRGWLEKKHNPVMPTTTPKFEDNQNYDAWLAEHIATLPELPIEVKNAYLSLAELCCSPEVVTKLKPMINTLKNFDDDEEYMLTLNYLTEVCFDQEITFIISLDCKQGIEDLELSLIEFFAQNYKTALNFPNAKDYPDNYAVGTDSATFEDFQKPIQKLGLQFGFIDTESTDFNIVIHKTEDKEKIKQLIQSIGHKYYQI